MGNPESGRVWGSRRSYTNGPDVSADVRVQVATVLRDRILERCSDLAPQLHAAAPILSPSQWKEDEFFRPKPGLVFKSKVAAGRYDETIHRAQW